MIQPNRSTGERFAVALDTIEWLIDNVDPFSIADFSKVCNVGKRQAYRWLKHLMARDMVVRTRTALKDPTGHVYGYEVTFHSNLLGSR